MPASCAASTRVNSKPTNTDWIETESKDALDAFIATLRVLAERAKSDPEPFHQAPVLTPRRRLDEVGAARKPVLRWRPETVQSRAAE